MHAPHPRHRAAAPRGLSWGHTRAGAATLDIIAQYVAAIRALREVDPSGVLLDAVGAPIKAYLRQRRVRAHAMQVSVQRCSSYGSSRVRPVARASSVSLSPGGQGRQLHMISTQLAHTCPGQSAQPTYHSHRRSAWREPCMHCRPAPLRVREWAACMGSMLYVLRRTRGAGHDTLRGGVADGRRRRRGRRRRGRVAFRGA